MNITYASRCDKCKGEIKSASGTERLTKLFEQMMRKVYEDNLGANQLDLDFYTEMTKQFNDALMNGYSIDMDSIAYNSPDLLAHQKLQSNLYAFSGAKTYSQIGALQNAIRDTEGKLRSYADFKIEALKINELYNLNWLQTEYNNALNSSIAAANWQRQLADSDLFPYLLYQTIGDSNVREEHQRLDGIKLPINNSFWNTHYPPNDWGCRCEALNDSDPDGLTDPDEADQRSEGAIRNKLFRNNPGQSGVIFKDNHPYFKDASKTMSELKAVENYGLPTVEKIYQTPSKLAKYATEFESKEAFETYWTDLVKASDVKNGFDIIDTNTTTKVVANDKLKNLLTAGENYKQAKEIISIIQKPNEVYNVGGETVYIRYYNDQPIAIQTTVNNRKKIIEISNFQKLTNKSVVKFRKGVLMFKK